MNSIKIIGIVEIVRKLLFDWDIYHYKYKKGLYKAWLFFTLLHFDLVTDIIWSRNPIYLGKLIKLMARNQAWGKPFYFFTCRTCVFYTNGCCKIGYTFMIGHVETWDDKEAFIKPQYHYGQIDRMGSLRRWRNIHAAAISLWWENILREMISPFNLIVARDNLILSGWWSPVEHEWKISKHP